MPGEPQSDKVMELEKLIEKQATQLSEQATQLSEQATLIEKQAKLIERLRKDVEKWKRGFRTRGRRFSSRPERKSGRERKKPGRKKGHPAAFREVPTTIDESREYPVPDVCACGSALEATGEVERVVEEEIAEPRIIRTEHCAHVGKCRRCGKRVMAKLPGAAPDGKPFAPVVLGPRAQALALSVRFEHHVSFRSTGRLIQRWFGLRVSAGGLSQIATRWARHTQAAKEEIRAKIRSAPVVGADETGLRQSGKAGWVWIARTPSASLFEVNPRRSGAVFDGMLGGFAGVLVTDFYGVYTARKDIQHSYCGAHLVREAKQIAEMDPSEVTREFADKLARLYKKGEAASDEETRESVRRTFRWMTTVRRFQKHPELARLNRRIDEHFDGIVAFLGGSDIPWHNNGSEQDIRPIAVHRNVVRCTRSAEGSNALGHWMSLTQTLRKNGSHLAEWFPDAIDAWRNGRPMPSVFPPN